MPGKETLQEVPRTDRRAVLVVNTHSRAGARLLSRSIDLLAIKGILPQEVHPVKRPERIPGIVKEAVDRGFDLIIVGGGDGTISSVVDYLAYRDIVLGILPLGTGNAFARTLGIPLDVVGAVEVIGDSRVADVDLGLVNGDYFANVASIGLSASVARSVQRHWKRRLGPLAYGLVGLGLLASAKPFQCRIQTPERDISVDSRQIVIANGRFFGIRLIGTEVHADDRTLAVFTFGGRSQLQFLKVWAAFLLGRHTSLAEANFLTTHELTVEADPPQWIDVDGELVARTPARFAVADGALKVLVPPGFSAGVDYRQSC